MTREVWIVGLDLAWKPTNASGWVILMLNPETHVLDLSQVLWLKNHQEVCQAIRMVPDLSRTVFAVDAPLVNQAFPGFRSVDHALLNILCPYRIGVLPPKFIQIASILELFRTLEIPLYPWPPKRVPGVIEVFPQWVSVGLWREPLLYKRRRLSIEKRVQHLWEVRQKVGAILNSRFVLSPTFKQWLNERSSKPPRQRLVDETDALFCALVPLWLHTGYPIRTIPVSPRRGRPYIITLWEKDL